MESLLTFDGLIALLTLTGLEVVLGIDNLVFISILVDKVKPENQRTARLVGLGLAMIFRIILLLSITWIIGLTEPIITVRDFAFSWRDIILLAGGLFLLAKSTVEIHEKLEQAGDQESVFSKKPSVGKSLMNVIIQIIAIDLVFSIDSILTAVGLTQNVMIMIISIVIAIIFMMLFAKAVSDFIHANPTIIMLALSFLIMIGTLLILDAFHFHVPRGYIYFAMGFSLFVEILNLRLLKKIQRKS